MSMRLFCVGAILMAAPASLRADDLKDMQGKWKLLSIEIKGETQKPNPDSPRFVQLDIDGDKVKVIFKDKTEEGSIKLDPAAKPKTINFKATTGRDKDKTLMGIYELKGDQLKLCVAAADKDRPKAFKGEGDFIRFMVFERVK